VKVESVVGDGEEIRANVTATPKESPKTIVTLSKGKGVLIEERRASKRRRRRGG